MSADAAGTGRTDGIEAVGATDGTEDPAAAWKQWHEHRVATVSAPYGPLALTGTHWLADYPEGRIPAVPGHWRAGGGGVTLTAVPGDGIALDGESLTGSAVLAADGAPPSHSRLRAGEVRLVVIRREGEWAVRVFDPAAPGRAAFTGIEATPYDPAYAVPGRFTPYGEDRTVQVENADGRVRGLGLGGELSFAFAGARHTLRVVVDEEDGSLWAVIGDATAGRSSYRFRFLKPGTPAADGSVTVDLNRVQLPPCAFVDHFVCPFPPPGNTLPFGIEAGERRLKGALASGI
ncbi:DUF1684 domain-containing protein [Streptomyces sp. NBC_01264]|uniref:DUF1684 domain-containing protein n=1 Tax=Streptomyces sp. NBC_01264 TaxID=2903804 RepID=UPI0022552F21|nr:DUF1684 domain-containing protein [Streptomyces sp. NBC_01264]MCX4777426.1 DUF1684 domain-containing protein [Streptomyces sp. NBC_01264]